MHLPDEMYPTFGKKHPLCSQTLTQHPSSERCLSGPEPRPWPCQCLDHLLVSLPRTRERLCSRTQLRVLPAGSLLGLDPFQMQPLLRLCSSLGTPRAGSVLPSSGGRQRAGVNSLLQPLLLPRVWAHPGGPESRASEGASLIPRRSPGTWPGRRDWAGGIGRWPAEGKEPVPGPRERSLPAMQMRGTSSAFSPDGKEEAGWCDSSSAQTGRWAHP